jgi:hypothetical protein
MLPGCAKGHRWTVCGSLIMRWIFTRKKARQGA